MEAAVSHEHNGSWQQLWKDITAPLIATWISVAALIWLFSPFLGASLIIIGTIILISCVSLRSAVLIFLLILPFDLQRQIGSQWIYLDLLTLAIVLPLFKLSRWPGRLCWLFVPFFLYFVATGAPRLLLPAWFWGYTIRWFIALCFSVAVALSESPEGFVLATGITLVPLTAYGLYQLLIGDLGWLFRWMNPHFLDSDWTARSYSLMWHFNAFGDFAGMIALMLFALGARGYRTALCYSLAAVGLVGVICSGSRGAEIGVAVAVLVALSQAPKFKRNLLVISIVALLVWGVQSNLHVLPVERVTELDDVTTEGRLLVWGAAYTVWQQNPWIGLGTTNFREFMPNLVDYPSAHAHDTYLQILAENGLIGFTLFYVPLFYLLWRAWRARKIPILFAGVCALVVWLIHGFVDFVLMDHPPCLLLFFMVIGLLVNGLQQQAQRLAHPAPTAEAFSSGS